jgi:hypothetical protein
MPGPWSVRTGCQLQALFIIHGISGESWLPPAEPQRAARRALIRGGDRDVLAGFSDVHIDMVRNYCLQLCPPNLVDTARLGGIC